MTLSDMEIVFWDKVDRDPFFMYVEDSLDHVDQYWVDLNRKKLADYKLEKIRVEEQKEYDKLHPPSDEIIQEEKTRLILEKVTLSTSSIRPTK